MSCILYAKEPMVLINNMDTYFKNTPPDCTLFSKNNDEIWVHKELLFQTKYMRDMLKSVITDSKIEVICPSLTTEELKTIVDFLYSGKVFCQSQISVSQVSKDLMDLFGFPLISNEIEDGNESMVMPNSRKKPRKQSLNSTLIRDDVPEMTIKVEPDLDNHIAVSFYDLQFTGYVSHGKITNLRPPLDLLVKIFSTIFHNQLFKTRRIKIKC